MEQLKALSMLPRSLRANDTSQLPDQLFKAELEENPADTLQRIRDLYAAESRGECDGLYLSMTLLHLEWALEFPQELAVGVWSTLMKHGLAEMYIGAVLAEDFFTHYKASATTIVRGLANLADGCLEMKDIESAKFMLSRCSEVFETIWEHRHALKHADTDPNESAFAYIVFHFSNAHHVIRGYTAGPDTYIPHVALYCWMHLPIQDNRDHALRGMRFVSDPKRTSSKQTLSGFTQTVVIDTLGGDAVLSRFEQHLETITNDKPADAIEVLGVMSCLVKHPAMYKTFQSRDTFRRIVEYLNRRIRSGTELVALEIEKRWTEWELSLPHFELVTEDLSNALTNKDMSHVTLRGEDAVMFLARGAEWVSRRVTREKHHQIEYALRIYGFWATAPEWRAVFPRRLVDGLIRGTRQEWLPTLDALRAGAYRIHRPGESYSNLVAAWTTFGTTLGLDEGKERKRLENEKRKLCSYQSCRFSRAVPEVAPMICKGCGDAWYCGRDCQRGDWKVHKQACGKRLK
ncbi:hypothetical protein PENSPDRAFT_735470 [Peniophora sp. CONT]|nr:hypothetical protein PENSPDRAFT_735470 [Peniophora sp. CONT]